MSGPARRGRRADENEKSEEDEAERKANGPQIEVEQAAEQERDAGDHQQRTDERHALVAHESLA